MDSNSPTVSAHDLEEIRRGIKAIRRLLGLLGPDVSESGPAYYDDDENPPPGKSVRAFRDGCRRGDFPSAHKVGRRWVIERDAFFRDVERTRLAQVERAEDDCEALLRRNGIRRVKGGGS